MRHGTLLGALVQSEEDQVWMGLARIERLDHLLLGLVKQILRDEAAHFVIFGVVYLGRRAGERGKIIEEEELGGGMLQRRGKEWMVISQERQPVDWRAYARVRLDCPHSFSPISYLSEGTYWRNSSPSLCRNAATTWIPRACGAVWGFERLRS